MAPCPCAAAGKSDPRSVWEKKQGAGRQKERDRKRARGDKRDREEGERGKGSHGDKKGERGPCPFRGSVPARAAVRRAGSPRRIPSFSRSEKTKIPPGAPKREPPKRGQRQRGRGRKSLFPGRRAGPERKNGGKRDPPSFIIDAKDPPRKRKRHFPQPEPPQIVRTA